MNLMSFVKDTTVLKLMKNFQFLEENARLFTMDIKGFYTNIPNDYGFNAMNYFREKREIQNLPTHTLRLAELVC